MIGWNRVHRLTLAREYRKEDVDRIKDVTQRIEKVRDLAIEYLTSEPEPDDARTASELRQQLETIAHALKLMAERRRAFDLRGEMIQLRRAITEGEYASTGRQPVPYNGETILEIRFASRVLLSELSRALDKAHP